MRCWIGRGVPIAILIDSVTIVEDRELKEMKRNSASQFLQVVRIFIQKATFIEHYVSGFRPDMPFENMNGRQTSDARRGTVMCIIKLNLFPVPMWFGKLISRRYLTMFFYI